MLLGIVCLLLLVAFPLEAATPEPPVATNVSVSTDNGRTRFSLEASRAVGFNVYVLPDPYRAIIDLPAVDFRLPVGSGGDAVGLLRGYRFGRMEKDRSRIVMDLKGPVLIEKSFVVLAKDGKPAQLVVDLVSTDAETFMRINRSEQLASLGLSAATEEAPPVSASEDEAEAPPRETPKEHPRQRVTAPMPQPKPDRTGAQAKAPTQPPVKPAGKRVVTIDPGHGGIDPGAIGVGGVAEKDVVLAFARHLRKALEQKGRYKVVLTRDDDVFLSLRDRVRVARSNNADLLIALHADSLKRRSSTRGATVYTLSEKASDAEAEALAQKENRADVIGGVDLGAESEEVSGILIDLAQRETKNHSMVFARRLAKELNPVTRLTNRPIRSAGFRVLKAPDVPSVLLELGYLSSKSDEALLTSEAWRQKVARSVAEAVDQYFATQIAAGH